MCRDRTMAGARAGALRKPENPETQKNSFCLRLQLLITMKNTPLVPHHQADNIHVQVTVEYC